MELGIITIIEKLLFVLRLCNRMCSYNYEMRKGDNMGMHLNPGNEAFAEIINGDYVDKTGLIDIVNGTINTLNKLTCISRPRRFGKSIAASMLVAYYDCSCDSHELFKDYEISKCESYEKHLNQYNVISLDITGFISEVKSNKAINKDVSDVPDMIREAIKKDIVRIYPDLQDITSLPECLKQYGEKSGRKFVFVIDEWDALIREAKEDGETQKRYLSFLRSLFKNRDFTPYVVAGCYMTGILPIKKDGTQSAISDFREYSVLKPGRFAKYTGFTEDDVRKLCEQNGLDFLMTKKWYDGYSIGKEKSIYNPYSVMQAVNMEEYCSYWKYTSAADALETYINMNFDGLKEMVLRLISGEEIEVSTDEFKNDFVSFRKKDDVLTLMIHLGYLTYDCVTGQARIPNAEVQSEFVKLVGNAELTALANLIKTSQKLLDDTLVGNSDEVAQAIERIRQSNYAPTFYNNEQALRYVIKFAYIVCVDRYMKVEELPSGCGIADVVYIPKRNRPDPAIVVELKWNKSESAAISQIKEKNYPAVLEEYGGEIVLVGINYDDKTKSHSCVIERVEK